MSVLPESALSMEVDNVSISKGVKNPRDPMLKAKIGGTLCYE